MLKLKADRTPWAPLKPTAQFFEPSEDIAHVIVLRTDEPSHGIYLNGYLIYSELSDSFEDAGVPTVYGINLALEQFETDVSLDDIVQMNGKIFWMDDESTIEDIKALEGVDVAGLDIGDKVWGRIESKYFDSNNFPSMLIDRDASSYRFMDISDRR